jgi:hypothetical protein
MGEAGNPVERESGDQPIAWPWFVRWLAVAYFLSYLVGYLGLLVLGVTAALLIAWQPGDGRVVVTAAAAGGCCAACAVFRWWFRSWGQRRWPASKPVAESDTAPHTSRLQASQTTMTPGSRYFFLGLGLLCLALGGVGLAFAIPEAMAASRLAFRTIPTVGTVLETRITPLPSSRKNRQKEGLVEYTVGDRSHCQWLRLFRYNDREPGETLPLWYDPAAEEVAGEPPNPVGYWLCLPPLAFFAVLGLYLSAAMIRLLLKGEPLTTGPPYPDMTPMARVALLVFGGVGVLAMVVLLFVVFAFAAFAPPNQTPADRWHAMQRAIGSNRGAFAIAFFLLTGLVLLCVKAIGRDPQLAHDTGRHLLISSGLALAAMAVVISLVAIGFGFR